METSRDEEKKTAFHYVHTSFQEKIVTVKMINELKLLQACDMQQKTDI
jgi:hypothetical protein